MSHLAHRLSIPFAIGIASVGLAGCGTDGASPDVSRTGAVETATATVSVETGSVTRSGITASGRTEREEPSMPAAASGTGTAETATTVAPAPFNAASAPDAMMIATTIDASSGTFDWSESYAQDGAAKMPAGQTGTAFKGNDGKSIVLATFDDSAITAQKAALDAYSKLLAEGNEILVAKWYAATDTYPETYVIATIKSDSGATEGSIQKFYGENGVTKTARYSQRSESAPAETGRRASRLSQNRSSVAAEAMKQILVAQAPQFAGLQFVFPKK